MKLLDKLINNIKFEKKYVLFSIIIVILGIITGSLFIVILNSADKKIVIEYISDFINNIGNINSNELLKNIILNNFSIILLMFIIGFSFFLFPINIIILFYKSFVVGFTLSSFILTYNIRGLLYSIIYIFPHLIINILIFALLTAFTARISINMIKHIINKKNVNMRVYFNKYCTLIPIVLFLISLTSLYETYIMPYLTNLFANI